MNRNINQLIIALFLSLFARDLIAQDIHFSQYYLSPLTQNPANAGSFATSNRFSALYRNQWYKASSTPFQSAVISFENAGNKENFILNNKVVKESNHVAWGGVIYFDRSGVGQLTNSSMYVNSSYIYHINNKQKVAVGVQVGFVQKTINFSNLTVDNQYNNSTGQFDTKLPSYENFNNNKLTYLNINSGVSYTHIIDPKSSKLYCGYSIFNLTTPKESFINAKSSLFIRHNLYAAWDKISETKTINRFLFNFQKQEKAQEIILGWLRSKNLNTTWATIIGVQSRFSISNKNIDAIIPVIGLKSYNWRWGFSYDINISQFYRATNFQGGPELAIIYSFGKVSNRSVNSETPCNNL